MAKSKGVKQCSTVDLILYAFSKKAPTQSSNHSEEKAKEKLDGTPEWIRREEEARIARPSILRNARAFGSPESYCV